MQKTLDRRIARVYIENVESEFRAKDQDTESACVLLEDLANDPQVPENAKMILFNAFDHLMSKDWNS